MYPNYVPYLNGTREELDCLGSKTSIGPVFVIDTIRHVMFHKANYTKTLCTVHLIKQ